MRLVAHDVVIYLSHTVIQPCRQPAAGGPAHSHRSLGSFTFARPDLPAAYLSIEAVIKNATARSGSGALTSPAVLRSKEGFPGRPLQWIESPINGWLAGGVTWSVSAPHHDSPVDELIDPSRAADGARSLITPT